MDVAFSLDPALPKRRGVEQAIRSAAAQGLLPEGSRMPAARELAADLGVSRGTVVAAIDDLVADGLLVTRPRAGTFVARTPTTVGRAAPEAAPTAPRLDLRPGRPESGSFPAARWAAAVRRAASTALMTNPVDDDGAGSLELRTELAAYLARSRGVETTPASLVVSAGYRSASTVLAVAMRSLGMAEVAIEDPALPGIDHLWRSAGLRVLDLPVDARGARTDRIGRDTDAVVLTPAHQFPLGGALDAERRRDVVAWARRTRRFIVEDDYDGEFRFDRRPVAALQRSAPDQVVYAGSVSKTLDTRLRLGWMALPHDLVAPVRASLLTLTGGVPLLDQLALADLIRSGDYERHVRRQRREYARRHDVLLRALSRVGVPVPGIPAGLQAVVPIATALRPPADADGQIRSGDFVTHSLDRYTRQHAQAPAAVVGFATPPRGTFGTAIDALTRWLQQDPR
ncbi:PLP-dependent aminotransferase family protein [Curtobacterium sp. 22159]|uniref:MocR-like pyridoxine biosynthesis transcription factor PdxR n=1 Tax=Curtobacterium sp. 22159 TaxID=3453882 RepID=UPI003F863101